MGEWGEDSSARRATGILRGIEVDGDIIFITLYSLDTFFAEPPLKGCVGDRASPFFGVTKSLNDKYMFSSGNCYRIGAKQEG